MANPRTPIQWQEAVNLAYFLMLLHSARSYGLVTGGPDVQVDRCQQLLEEGRLLGYVPTASLGKRQVPS